MQTLTLLRLLAALVITAGVAVASPYTDPDEGSVVVAQDSNDDDDDRGDNGDAGDDDNRGHGNDDDGHDEDNPGRGNDNGNQGPGGGNDDNRGPGNASDPVAQAENYRVDVTCDYDDRSGRTTCTFTGAAPPDAKDIGHLDLPEEAVCTRVVGGEYEYVDPDPNTRVTGYKSLGSEGELTLVLEGKVTTFSSTTYWLKAGDGVFPATGPALFCGDDAATATAETTAKTAATSTPVADTGTVTVAVSTCADVPDDRTGFDWFGMCEPGGEALTFELSTPTGEALTAETDASGEVAFEFLAPGNYGLDAVDASWCHAKSDNVTAEGELIVESGVTSTVWIFICGGTTGDV